MKHAASDTNLRTPTNRYWDTKTGDFDDKKPRLKVSLNFAVSRVANMIG
jgi:hypothetical protein